MSRRQSKVSAPVGPDDVTRDIRLRQTLGLHHGVAFMVGVMIGSGIFVSPRGVLQEAGSIGAALLVWLFCGVISLIGALCYAELGTSIPKSGHNYIYIHTAFGPFAAFTCLWAYTVLVLPTFIAIMALTFAHYVLQPVFSACSPPGGVVSLVAAVATCLISFVSGRSVRAAATLQTVFSVAKVAALAVIIVTGLVQLLQGDTARLQQPFAHTRGPGGLAMAVYSGLFSYTGWSSLSYMTEELRAPERNLPRAAWISVPLVTVVYVLANVSYATVLGVSGILASPAVAVTFALRTLGPLASAVPLCVAASTFGGSNGAIFYASRLYFIGARQGHLPDAAALINVNYLTPLPAILLTCLLSLVMMFNGSLFQLIHYVTFLDTAYSTLAIAGMLWLRYRKPRMHRPIRVHLVFPVLFLLVQLFLVLVPIIYQARDCLVAMAMMTTAIPVYIIFIKWKNKPTSVKKVQVMFTHFVQKLTLSAPETKQD